jgi:hypothetical protein
MVLRLACLLACSLIFLLGDGIEVHHFGSHKAAAAADLFRTERGEHALSGLKPERNLPWMGRTFFKILSAEDPMMA